MNKSTMTLVNTFILAAASYEDAMAKLQDAYRGDKLSPADLRLALAMALVHHHPSKYAGQMDRATGQTVRDSALRKQVNRYASAIMGKGAAKPSEEIGVPKHIQELANKLAQACAEYESARKLCNTAVATAFAK
jgi:hypothetical protein